MLVILEYRQKEGLVERSSCAALESNEDGKILSFRFKWVRGLKSYTVTRFEKFSLNFSILLFVIRVNLLHN